jgi:hypothetical protein
MNPIHRIGFVIAALVAVLTLAGAFVAQGYYSAMANATPAAAATTPAPTEAATPEPTATDDAPVIYVAAPTVAPAGPAGPAAPPRPAPVVVPARPTPLPTPATLPVVTPEPTDNHGTDD